MVQIKTLVHAIGLSEAENQTISKFLAPGNDIKLVTANQIEQLASDIRDRQLNFIIINSSFNKPSVENFIKINSGFFLNTKVLILLEQHDDLLDFENLSPLFKSTSKMGLNLSLINKASTISEFINENNYTKSTIYLPLDIKLFLNLPTTPCDLFIKLTDKKFIKILSRENQQAPYETLKKYLDKGINEIFLENNDLAYIQGILTKEIFKIEPTKNVALQKLQIAESVISVAKDFGVSDILLEGINDTFNELTNDLKSDKKLLGLLAMINNNTNSIISNHSYLTAVFCSMIIGKVSWGNSTLKKSLCTAALLHDLDIIDSKDMLCEFKTLEEINKLDSKNKNLFINHGVKLAAELSKNNAISGDVLTIISKHHDGAGALGYPQGVNSAALTPLNCLFNTAHQLSIELSRVAFNQDKIDIALNKVKEHYSGINFRPFFEILDKEIKPAL